MSYAGKFDLITRYVERIMEDMDHKTMAAIVADIIWDEKYKMDRGELIDEIMEYYPDLIPEGE